MQFSLSLSLTSVAVRLSSTTAIVGDTLDILGLSAAQAQAATFRWQLDGATVSGATGPDYTTVAAGEVTAVVTLNGSDYTAPAIIVTAAVTGGGGSGGGSSGATIASARITSASDGIATGSGAYLEITLDGEWVNPVLDASKITVSASSLGYDEGTAAPLARTIECLTQRHGHPTADDEAGHTSWYVSDDGAGNSIVHAVLAEPVYASDTSVSLDVVDGWITADAKSGVAGATSVADTGDEPYPVVHAKWATDDLRPLLLDDATFEVCAQSALDYDALTGHRRPCDSVEFTISNGVTTVVQTVSAITNSTYADEVDAYLSTMFGASFGTGSDTALTVTRPAGIPASPVFACTVDLAAAGFAVGDTITVDAVARPFVGDATNAKTTADGDEFFAQQTHKILGTARKYAFIDQTLDNGTIVNPNALYDDIATAMANPFSHYRFAAERADPHNGSTQDGMVYIVKPGSDGSVQIGIGNGRVGSGSAAVPINNDAIIAEFIPAPGVDFTDPSDCALTRNELSSYGTGSLARGGRFYGFGIDATMTGSAITSQVGSQTQKRMVSSVFCTGSVTATASAQSISAGDVFIMGGTFEAMPGGAFGDSAVIRGVKVVTGGAGQNAAQLVLGSDITSFPVIVSLAGSGISNAGKMRWSLVGSSSGNSIQSAEVNSDGFSVLGVAYMGGVGGGSGASGQFNSDGSTQTLQNMRVVQSAILGGRRINAQYDHSPTPSGPKWSNELVGSVIVTYNHKRPAWGMSRSSGESDYTGEDQFYRWGVNDAHWYGVGKHHCVILGSSSDTAFTTGSYVGPQRYRGARYGMPNGGEPQAEIGFPQPFADPANGDWSVLSDVAWQALPSTIELAASARRDLQEDYTTNLVAGVVPATRVALPFDLFGTAYPTSGMVEAGPVLR